MTATTSPRATLRRREAATSLGVSLSTLDRMIGSGELPSFLRKRTRFIPAASVQEYIARKLRGAA